MDLIPLPDATLALRDTLFKLDGREQAITEGYEKSTPQMQQAYPLVQRLEQERQAYQHRVEMLVMGAIKANQLTARSYDGFAVPDPWGIPDPVPLALSLKDLELWLHTALSKAETRALMERLQKPKPKKAPGRKRSGGPDDETLLKDWNAISHDYITQGNLLIAKRVIAAYPDRYRGMEPDAIRKRYERAIPKTGHKAKAS